MVAMHSTKELTESINALFQEDPALTLDQVVDELLHTLPLHDVGRVLLPEYVRNVARSRRNSSLPGKTPKADPPAQPTATQRTGKMAQARDTWEAFLDSWTWVPELDKYKRGRDLTTADMRSCAVHRYNLAERNMALGKKWDEMADTLESLGKSTLGDVPRTDVSLFS